MSAAARAAPSVSTGAVVDLAADLLGDRARRSTPASPSRSPCSARRRSGRAGGGRGSSARSGGGAGSRGTAAGSRSAPSTSSARPGRPRGRRRPGGGRGRWTKARISSPSCDGSEAGSMRGPATTIMRSSGTRSLRLRERLDHAPQQVAADARAADRDDADLLVGPRSRARRGAPRGRRSRRDRSR